MEATLVPPRVSERLLLETLGTLDAARVFCVSPGRAQLAARCGELCPDAHVACNFLDLYQAERARQSHEGLANLKILCQADVPEAEFDRVELPLTAHGDAEWTRDLLQASHCSLRLGGVLRAATDNPRDRWLRAELEKLFDRVSSVSLDEGVVYRGVKHGPLKKRKNFDCEYAFRDQGRLLKVFSRPGVFSHRRIDTGARALLEAMTIQPGDRVLDLGCGCGVVSLAALSRADAVWVMALDSNPRAVECTRRSASLNGFTNLRVELDADARCDEPGTYDVVVTNPPYFSDHRITEIFLAGAVTAMKPAGTLYVVTKDAEWFCDAMQPRFRAVKTHEVRGYTIVSGRRR